MIHCQFMQDPLPLDLPHLVNKLKSRCDWVSLRYQREVVQSRKFRNEKSSGQSLQIDEGLQIEVFVDGSSAIPQLQSSAGAVSKKLLSKLWRPPS